VLCLHQSLRGNGSQQCPLLPCSRPYRLATVSQLSLSLSLNRNSRPRIQSHVTTDDHSVSPSWCRAPSGAHDQILITVWQLLFCRCRAPALTRGRVCHLSPELLQFSSVNLLLALAKRRRLSLYNLGTDLIENIYSNSSSVVVARIRCLDTCLLSRYIAADCLSG
jgi:hypothetical protein